MIIKWYKIQLIVIGSFAFEFRISQSLIIGTELSSFISFKLN